ncbi:MAG: hypothetical protein M1483_05490 [Actinobacteria bacterium]|jgi:hypothetical protein|nr:hypothetical protein [Actinomycetota bacterium]
MELQLSLFDINTIQSDQTGYINDYTFITGDYYNRKRHLSPQTCEIGKRGVKEARAILNAIKLTSKQQNY